MNPPRRRNGSLHGGNQNNPNQGQDHPRQREDDLRPLRTSWAGTLRKKKKETSRTTVSPILTMARAIIERREMAEITDCEAREGAGEAGAATSPSGNPRGTVEARGSVSPNQNSRGKQLSASDPVTAPRTSPTVSKQVKIFEAQRDGPSRSVVENRVKPRKSQN